MATVMKILLRLALVGLVCGLAGAGVGYLLDAAVTGAVFGAVIGLGGFVGTSRATRAAGPDRTLTDSAYVGFDLTDRDRR